jgi:CHAT domain-containing protein
MAIAAYRTAVAEGEGTGEPGLELRPRGILAGLYAELRGEAEAWTELYSALESLEQRPEDLGDAQRLFVMAAHLSRRRCPPAALLFQQEAVRLARLVDGPGTMTISALSQQAELLGRAGMADRALESLREARVAADNIASDSIRAIKTADVDLVAGEVWLRVRPDSAAIMLRRAVERYRSTQYLLEVDRAQLLLANAYASSGKMDSARRAFDAALSETERQRAEILDPEDRIRFLDQARPVIDRVVGFLADQSDTLGALEFFEQMRARVLLERVRGRLAGGVAPVPVIDRLRNEMSPGASVVSYAVLDSELVAWVIRRGGVTMHRTPLDIPLAPLVERFSTLIEARAGENEVRPIAARLYEVLIAPVSDEITPGTRLVFIPDEALHFVPFAALFDSSSGRFLVESFEIDVAPSVALYQQSAARYAALGTAGTRVLAVGNPAFDEAAIGLPRLPGAEREAARVADDYEDARLLVGAAATKRAFLREAVRANIVHFAGHGVVKPDAPLLSHLVLAPEPVDGSSGALYARELFDVTLPRTRLTILSGCHTAGGELSTTEGVSSLARALFAAGVPAVVASLWAVDDERTAMFFATFHRELARGTDPVTALRHTQLQSISQRRESWSSLSTWAAFQLFGATGTPSR